jgi:crotonobetainyl-CoA:carnitine CoA-transferase CaiB-like acyl-CoA transferase
MKLEGVRVVDMSQFLPGPFLSNMMADHGASVIKIEPPGGDPGREIGLGENGTSVFFRNMNRGKRSVCLDLKKPAELAAMLALCDQADVFIESSRPGVAQRLGIGQETLRARNPRLVYCSISAFGQDGPYRQRPAHDLAVEAMAGAVSCNLGADGLPAIPGIPVADIAGSAFALAGVLMALYRRHTTGRGDYIDMSMHDAVLASFPNVLGTTFVQKRPPDHKLERSWGGAAFYQVYATRDGRHIVLGGQEHKFVRNLLGALGREDLIPPCERGPGAHQRVVIEYFRDLFKTRTQAEWVEWLATLDVCFAPVNNLREAFDDPHARARGMRLLDEHGAEHVGPPIKFASEPARPSLHVPTLGEHNVEVLGSLLP